MMHYLAIGTGGMIGALLRFWLGLALEPAGGSFPLGTLTANWIGCLALGWFNTRFSRLPLPSAIRTGIGTGLIASFTTFSTFSVETHRLIQSDQPGAALYLLSSLWGGLFLLWIGNRIGNTEKGEKAPC